MKIPRAMPPLARPAELGVAAKTPSASLPAAEGLTLRHGAISFAPESVVAGLEQQLARARTFLEILRSHIPAEAEPVMAPLEVELPGATELDAASISVPMAVQTLNGSLKSEQLGDADGLHPDWAFLLRYATRVAELGYPVVVAPGLWSSKAWPTDPASAALLRRSARAFNVDPTTIRFGSTTLGHHDAHALKLGVLGSKSGTYDTLASLANYYPSLALGRKLAAMPELEDALTAFADRLPIPDDLQPLVDDILQVRPKAGLAPFVPAAPLDLASSVTHAPASKIVDRRRDPPEFSVGINTPIAFEAPTWSERPPPDLVSCFVTEATDENLNSLKGRRFVSWSSPGEGVTTAQALIWAARAFELRPPTNEERSDVSGMLLYHRNFSDGYYVDDCIAPLLRLAEVLKLDPLTVKVPNESGVLRSLRDRALELNLPRTASEPSTPQRIASWVERLADPAATVDQRIEALERLQQHDAGSLTFQQLIGQLPIDATPIDFATLTPTQKSRLAAALTAEPHLGVTSILTGLLTVGAEQSLAPLTKSWFGVTPADARQWQAIADALPALPARDRLFVLDELRGKSPDFFNVALRTKLAQSGPLDARQVAEYFTEFSPIDSRGTLRTLVDWSASRGPEQVNVLTSVFESLFEQGAIGPVEISYALAGERAGHVSFTGVPEALEGAIQAVVESDVLTRAGAIDHLASLMTEAVKRGAPVPVLQILQRVLDHDLSRVMPLDEADNALGGVAARGWVDKRSISERLGLASPEPEARQEALAQWKSSAYARLAHRLAIARVRLELSASHDAGFDVKGEARAEAHQIIEKELADRMRQASTDEQREIVAVGSVALGEFEAWADALATTLGRISRSG